MGLQITHTKKGYRIKDSTSDQYIHDKKYLNENEVKVVLIKRRLINFFEEVIKIDLDFLSGYTVNGKFHKHPREVSGLQFILNCFDNGEGPWYEQIEAKAQEILKRLDVQILNEPKKKAKKKAVKKIK